MEPIHINGVGEYTLSYYSTDLFGNIETVKTQTFTLTELPETYSGKISGYIYSDDNNNGVQDQGEKNMAGWKICMDLNNNNECEENVEPFNVTNNTGYYEFDSLETRDYKILQIQRNNWQVTNPIHGYYDINLSNGEHKQNINFGNYKIKGNNKK